MKKYDDIINLKHHISYKHARMSILDRAAQFSSFSALTGYDDVIDEVKRVTDDKVEFDECFKNEVNETLKYIIDNIKNKPFVCVTYFLKDKKKTGGKYVTQELKIVKYNEYENTLATDSGINIKIEDIQSIKTI